MRRQQQQQALATTQELIISYAPDRLVWVEKPEKRLQVCANSEDAVERIRGFFLHFEALLSGDEDALDEVPSIEEILQPVTW